MKPLNRVERNRAFLSFLLLFFITVGIVVAVFFLSIKVPLKENEQLRSRIRIMQKERDLSDSFKVAMDGAINELAKFNLREDSVGVIQRRVQLKINKMSRIVEKMPGEISNDEKSMYNLVIQNLDNLSNAKLRIRNLEAQRN